MKTILNAIFNIFGWLLIISICAATTFVSVLIGKIIMGTLLWGASAY